MPIINLRKKLALADVNRKGKRLRKKYLIIESDDWGSIRIPSKQAQKVLENEGIDLFANPYLKYDGLESTQDVMALFEVLSSVKNQFNQNPKITLNTVTHNPDIQKIRESGFKEYSREPIQKTYHSFDDSDIFKIISEGIENNLCLPQFHGTEHVNVPLWLSMLQESSFSSIIRKAFEAGIAGIPKEEYLNYKGNLQATYESTDIDYVLDSLQLGLTSFESLWGFKSKTFIANNYVWDSSIEEKLNSLGVEHFQGMKYQLLPYKTGKLRHVNGEHNSLGQTFGVRNCHFEPSEKGTQIDQTLEEVKSAFAWGKPAVLCTHRMNFTSRFDVQQRDSNLKDFNRLLTEIVQKWPDVIFLNSAEFATILKNGES